MSVEGSMRTESGIEVKPLYTADNLQSDLEGRLGLPGHPPFTRGPYESMYRERLWSMRQYSGYGSAEETNERYRFLLSQGQTALSVAFDLPTQLGLDSSHSLAEMEVGRVGVAIDTADDMGRVFQDLPLDELSVNFTINATAPILLAFYIVAAEKQGVDMAQLSGTLQNDILKEFLARKTFIYPPGPSVRIACDVVEFCSQHMPRFNPISITGYHAREAGCSAIEELAFTFADAIAYCDELVGRGIDFDSFAPRLSFHFASQMDFFEEIAKVRAARRMWFELSTKRYGAKEENSSRLRFFSGCSGATLTAQQPFNNIIRSTLQCLAAVLGGAQSIHVMGYDEALAIPTEESATLALRTQQIIAHESGVTKAIDPLGGSYFLESLTDELQREAEALLNRIQDGGGSVQLIQEGVMQRWIADNAYKASRDLASGARPRVGVNIYVDENPVETEELFEPDPAAGDRQVAVLAEHLLSRDTSRVENALKELAKVVALGENIMPSVLEAARAAATVGEIANVLRDEYGEYVEPVPW
jgi:methylmalonyl-CoA mutase N-terminal domain/subunit